MDASETVERVKAKLKMRFLDVLDSTPGGEHMQLDRQQLEGSLRQVWEAFPEEVQRLNFTPKDEEKLFNDIIDELTTLGPIERFMHDETINEIMVNGPKEIFVERNGHLERVEAQFRDTNHLMTVIERMLSAVGLTVNESDPLCDASLGDGTRVNVIIPPLVLNGPVLTIRRKGRDWTMQDLVGMGSLTEQAAEFLASCVRAKVNLIISGGTSTGKTTLVSVLSSVIPADHRVITIENVAELELQGRKHWIRLVARQTNIEGRGEVSLRALVKNALRMRPDRIILGEARGGEALDVVQAMHSGHEGVITVLHGNTPHAALDRLQTLMLMSGLELPPSACRMQIAGAVDLIIHLSRYADGSRKISAITQVLGGAQEDFQLEELFTFQAKGYTADRKLEGDLRYTGARPRFLSKFELSNVPIPSWLAT